MIQNSKFKIQNSRKGFTLIELMVVMAIVGILAATAMVNFGQNADRDVRQEKDRLTSFLREVQNKALTAEKVSTASGKVCGFGITFDGSNSSAKVFYVETVGIAKLDVDCAGVGVSKKNNPGTNSTATVFPNGTFIFRNSVTVDGALPDDIFFLVPNGEIYYDGINVSVPTINLTKGSITPIPVNIDPSGRIY